MEQQIVEKRRELLKKIYTLLGVQALEGTQAEEREYLEKVRTLLLGQGFMRLGHCIQGGSWNLVLSNGRKLKKSCNELGVTCFDRYLDGMRGAAVSQNTTEAVQLMSRITEKRVQLRALLTEERELCGM